MSVHSNEAKFITWIKENNFKLSHLFPTINKNKVHLLDLSTTNVWVGQKEEFNNIPLFQQKIDTLQVIHPDKIIAGGYLEPRKLYTDKNYERIGSDGIEYRNIHLGVDYWLPEQTPIHALLGGEVVTSINNEGHKAYGGLIILKHTIDDFEFFTLYGHLSLASITAKKVGHSIKKGNCIGYLGSPKENGDWVPHLHFQVMLTLLDYKYDFPGVAYPNEIDTWKQICPDPNLLFNLSS